MTDMQDINALKARFRVPEAPDGRRHLLVAKCSGGRSSALASRMALDAGICERVVFCNTGLESDVTFEFLEAVNQQWLDGRLEIIERYPNGYEEGLKRDPGLSPIERFPGGRSEEGDVRRLSSLSECARAGEPMEAHIQAFGLLPSRMNRFCTKTLKIHAVLQHLYESAGLDYRVDKVTSIIGFRNDETSSRMARFWEGNRVVEAREDEGKPYLKWSTSRWAPLVDLKMAQEDVLKEYRRSPLKGLPFDPSNPLMRLSNCLGCFFSRQGEFKRIVREAPGVARFWDRMERRVYEIRGSQPREAIIKRRAPEFKRLKLEPADDFERGGQSCGNVPWAVMMRQVDTQTGDLLEESGTDMYAGGCGDGECGLDI